MRTPISLVILLLTGIVAILLIYFGNYQTIYPIADSSAPNQRPDFFMDDISSIKLNLDGSIHYRLTASNLAHYARLNRTELTNPQLTLYQKDRTPWELSAKTGTLLEDGNSINLKDQVQLIQKAENKSVPTKLTTTEITIKPDEHYAITDQPIKILSAEGLTTATGLKAFFNTNKMELLSEVNGVYYRQ